MLNKEILGKLIKYNKLRQQTDTLRTEIESYLFEKYGISENVYVGYNSAFPFSSDGVCSIYENGEEYFDVNQIEKIVNFIEKYQKEVGESPEIYDIVEYFERKH